MKLSKFLPATALGLSLALSGCFHDAEESGNDTETEQESHAVKISGVVYVPSAGSFEKVSLLSSVADMLFGKAAFAVLEGTTPLGAGAIIKLVDTTLTGDEAIIAQTTSGEGGAYELDAPEGFEPAPKYVVRAEGSNDQVIETRVSATTELNVDPLTHATSKLVDEIASDATALSELTTEELLAILEEVESLLAETETDITSLTSVDDIATEITSAALGDEDTANVLFSTASSGSICGTVTGASGQGLESVSIVARDYRNWVTRAKTKTDANGAYCLNVPVSGETVNGETHDGEYILGAINRTGNTKDSDKHASEWWTADGGKALQWEGEKVSLTSTDNSLSKNFVLALGARIKGTVTDSSGNPLEGVSVVVRDYKTWFPLYASKTKSDGTYKMSVPEGDFIVIARNSTRAPYATEVFTDSDSNGIGDGNNTRELGEKISVAVGDEKTLTFNLQSGVLVKGEVLDSVGGNAVSGVRVRFDATTPTKGFAAAVRTNKNGKYRLWLKPQTYNIYSHGQTEKDVDLASVTTGSKTVRFDETITTKQVKLLRAGQPVSQAVTRLYDKTAKKVFSQEISASDGIVDIFFSSGVTNAVLEIKIKEGKSGAGGIVWVDQTSDTNAYTMLRSEGSAISTSTVPTEINLPAGYEFSGTMTVSGNVVENSSLSVEADTGSGFGKYSVGGAKVRTDGSYNLYLPAGDYRVTPIDGSNPPASIPTADSETFTVIDTGGTFNFAL